MLRSRNLLLLLGVAGVAFAAFLWTGNRSGTEEVPTGGAPAGSLTEGGRSGQEGASPDQAAAEKERKRAVATLKARSRRAASGKPREVADPKLLEQLQSSSRSLVPVGPAESPREGIVRQSFTGSQEIRGGAAASSGEGQGTGDAGEESPPEEAEDETAGECGDCGAPSLKTTVADLVVQPMMRAAYEKPCGGESLLINAGYGERFNIGDDPACVFYIPQTCRGSGVAIFDDRFVISVHGECIPSQQYLKTILQR
jgi:hypothetical protein